MSSMVVEHHESKRDVSSLKRSKHADRTLLPRITNLLRLARGWLCQCTIVDLLYAKPGREREIVLVVHR